jgi:hypothetical protein
MFAATPFFSSLPALAAFSDNLTHHDNYKAQAYLQKTSPVAAISSASGPIDEETQKS